MKIEFCNACLCLNLDDICFIRNDVSLEHEPHAIFNAVDPFF